MSREPRHVVIETVDDHDEINIMRDRAAYRRAKLWFLPLVVFLTLIMWEMGGVSAAFWGFVIGLGGGCVILLQGWWWKTESESKYLDRQNIRDEYRRR